MVVLMEEFGGLSLKRKDADDRSVFPPACRATKMRRLASPDAGQDAASGGGVEAAELVDLPMGDATPPPAAEEEKAVVLCGGGSSDSAQSALRLRPCGVAVRGGADWAVRAILREADSRMVRELLAGAEEHGGEDLALAVVPWVPPSPAGPSDADEAVDDGDGAAAMDVEEEEEGQVHHWPTRQAGFGGAGAGCGEGFVYRWPPQLPVVGQASPVMWSW